MHELSIALSLVDLASEEVRRLGAVRVEKVHVRVGAVSGVVAEALSFSFEAAAEGTPIEGAQLQIEQVAATVWCSRCAAERALLSLALRRCPVCGAVTPRLIRGEELELTALEVSGA